MVELIYHEKYIIERYNEMVQCCNFFDLFTDNHICKVEVFI